MPSPCVGICAYQAALGFCLGCGRTLAEIGAWPTADTPSKRSIAAAAAARLGTAPDAGHGHQE